MKPEWNSYTIPIISTALNSTYDPKRISHSNRFLILNSNFLYCIFNPMADSFPGYSVIKLFYSFSLFFCFSVFCYGYSPSTMLGLNVLYLIACKNSLSCESLAEMNFAFHLLCMYVSVLVCAFVYEFRTLLVTNTFL